MIGIPFAEHPWNEIIPGLWQGGVDYKPANSSWGAEEAVVGNEFQLVVSMYTRLNTGPADGIPHWRTRIPDGVLNDNDWTVVDSAVERVLKALEAGERVLVRCQAGYNRSGLVVALVLLKLGHTATDAIELIRNRRSKWALCNEHFVRYIHEREPVESLGGN